MPFSDYDLTAPYRGAVDATSRYLIPAVENSPVGAASRALRQGAGNLYSNYLRGPMKAGAKAMSGALQGVPPIGPVGLMKDMSGLMARDDAPPAPVPPQAAPGPMGPPQPPAAPAAPMAMGSPAPAPMPAPSPAAAAPQGSAGAGPTSPPPGVAPTAPPPQAGSDAMTARPEDAALREQQDALDEYYTGVVGTGPAQRKSERMFALANTLRANGGRDRDWASQLSDAIAGGVKGYALYKGMSGESDREGALEELRSKYLRRRAGGGAGGLEQLSGPGMDE